MPSGGLAIPPPATEPTTFRERLALALAARGHGPGLIRDPRGAGGASGGWPRPSPIGGAERIPGFR